ncbi:MAG: hypothetical protein ACRCUB_07195 [Plesiomonas shigelloides]
MSPQSLAEDATGADWPSGVVAVTLSGEQTTPLPPGDVMLVMDGDFGIKRYRLTVETMAAPTRTSLFIKDIVVGDMRNEQLMAAAAGVLQDVKVSDDYIWNKIRAAESEIGHRLRVPLVPTRFFPTEPTQEQIDALDGMAWAVDSGHDYMPDMFERDKWGFIVTRQRPIISIEKLRFAMPSADGAYFDIPKEWIRIDARYGHIRILPTTNAYLVTGSIMGMTALTWQSTIPNMIQLEYTAGLSDVSNTYPELIDAIKKQAVCKIVTEAFLPQSGSINADGLSQSLSVDISKYQETIDHIIDGPDGANGGLQAKINGIRTMVI